MLFKCCPDVTEPQAVTAATRRQKQNDSTRRDRKKRARESTGGVRGRQALMGVPAFK